MATAEARSLLQRHAEKHGYQSIRWEAPCWQAALGAIEEALHARTTKEGESADA